MKLSIEEKAIIRAIVNASGDHSDIRELIANVQDAMGDGFTVHHAGYDWRVIDDLDITEIMCNDLEHDTYLLGCFSDWFLADILSIDIDVIQALQKAEAFDALGKLVLSMGKLEALQEAYANADGYGHHFSSYDGNGYETETVNGTFYHIFNQG